MHGSFDRSRETDDNSTYRSWGLGFFALPALLAIVLVGLAIVQPSASNWISEAAQAEFAVDNFSAGCRADAAREAGHGNSYRPGRLTDESHPGARLAPRSIVNSTSFSPRE